jgi:hypothetical protein
MNHRYRYVFSFFVITAALAAPSAIRARQQDDRHQEEHQRDGNREGERVYDRSHKDYHNWDANEDHAYRGYLQGNHREYRPYAETNSRQQRSYWNWRHSHPDRDHDGR